MNAIPHDAKQFVVRVALHDAAQALVCNSAMLMCAAHVSEIPNLRELVGSARSAVLEAIRLLKMLEDGEALHDAG